MTAVIEAEPQAVPTKVYELERCDACGARAYWAVYFDDSELTWCNHHYIRFQAKFADKTTVKLVIKPEGKDRG